MSANEYTNLMTRLSGSVQAVPTMIGGVSGDYENLTNKPRINGVELIGDLTAAELGICGTDGLGISSAAAELLISILRKAVYVSDQDSNITALENALSSETEDDNGGEDNADPVMYSVSRKLTNASADNTVSSVAENSTYSCVVRAADGYVLSLIHATMGNNTIYSQTFPAEQNVASYGMSFSPVIGDIVISAKAVTAESGEEDPTTPVMYSVAYNLTNVESSTDVTSVQENSVFECQINAVDGYAITSVHATMGEEVLQDQSFTLDQQIENIGVMSTAVTGNIVITAVAEKIEVVAAVNLFDKNSMVIEGAIVGSNAQVSAVANAAYAKIPIEAGKTYCVSMKAKLWSNGTSGNKLIVDADENTLSAFSFTHDVQKDEYYIPSNPSDITAFTAGYDTTGRGFMFVAPENAAEFWMTTKFNGIDCSETLMFEGGDTVHDYVAYGA